MGGSEDAGVEASKGGSAGAKAGAGGAAGKAGGGGGGGASGAAGKAGGGGADSGAGGAGDAAAGSPGDDGGGGTDSSTGDTGVADGPVDAPEEPAPPVCSLQTGQPTCQGCMVSHCNAECLQCEGNPFCAAIVACVGACTDNNCRKKCWDNNKDGQDDFNALASQSGCLQDYCATECPNLPDTSGCSMSAGMPVRTSWLLFAAVLGAVGLITRRRSR